MNEVVDGRRVRDGGASTEGEFDEGRRGSRGGGGGAKGQER